MLSFSSLILLSHEPHTRLHLHGMFLHLLESTSCWADFRNQPLCMPISEQSNVAQFKSGLKHPWPLHEETQALWSNCNARITFRFDADPSWSKRPHHKVLRFVKCGVSRFSPDSVPIGGSDPTPKDAQGLGPSERRGSSIWLGFVVT